MRGLSGVAAKVVELQAARDVAKVKLAGPQAKALLPDLVKADVDAELMTTGEMGGACTAFQEAVKNGPDVQGALVHFGQGELDLAVENAETRFSGESEVWNRKDRQVDDSPLVACSGAFYLWGLMYQPNYDVLESVL